LLEVTSYKKKIKKQNVMASSSVGVENKATTLVTTFELILLKQSLIKLKFEENSQMYFICDN